MYMKNLVKVALAILLFICLNNMPYGYFQMVRFVALIGFLFLANRAYQKERQNEAIIYLVLALLFQPFFKIAFGRQIWNVIDVIIGLGLILSIFLRPGTNKEFENHNTDESSKR